MDVINEWAYCIFHPKSYRARTTHLRIKRSTEQAIFWGLTIFTALCIFGIGWYANVITTRLEQNRLIKQYNQELIQRLEGRTI